MSSAITGHAQAEQSLLLELAQKLHCAPTEQEASALLLKLSSLPIKPFGIPDDNLNADEKSSLLYAATVDVLLQVLYETIQHYPKLQESAERSVLMWNYCEIIAEGKLADLSLDDAGQIIKRQAAGPFPANKKGFGIWGFLKPDPANRYVPKLIPDPSVWPAAYEDLLHRLHHLQCVPHPETGELASEMKESPLFGGLRMEEELPPGKRYPYFWKSECAKAAPPAKPVIKAAPKPVVISKAPPVQISEAPKPAPKPEPKAPQPKSKPQSNPQPAKTEKPPPKKKILDLVLKKYTQPAKGEQPIRMPAIAAAGSNAGAPLPLPPADGLGIAGNIYHRSKLTEGQSFGANIGWKPYSYFFIRGGANYSYSPGDGQFSYSWGIGYDDWHPGTISVQLNNWGPILPEEGLALDRAVANIAYKFEAQFLRPYHITGSAAVDIPVDGDPKISTTWSWSPIENWFIRASLQRKFGSDGGWNWSYNFGYSNWRPFTVSLTYDNWGTNPIFDAAQGSNFNFQENGAVSLSWSWAF